MCFLLHVLDAGIEKRAVAGVVAYINSTTLRLLNLWKWLVILEVDRDLN